MARVKAFDQQEILDKALDLFWEKGYSNTSIQDLVDCLGLGRGSLYNAFDSKHGLFLQVLDDYRSKRNQLLNSQLKKSPVKEAFQQYFQKSIDEMINQNNNKGCFIVNTMNELARVDEAVKAKLIKSEEELLMIYKEALTYGVDLGEITLEHDLNLTASFLSNTMKGLRVLSRVDNSRDTLEGITSLALTFLG